MNTTNLETTATPLRSTRPASVLSRWVCFELSGQRYAVGIDKVFEVLSSADIEPVPAAPAGVLGVINLRGSIVTVLDLLRWMAFSPSEHAGCILIANHHGEPVGFRVDRIIEVVNLSADAIRNVAPGQSDEFLPAVSGLVNRNGEILTLLELSRLLPADSAASTPK